MHCVRLTSNPIITPDSCPRIGDNINGPSIIKVPSWIDQPLGAYYCYFAHHSGSYIRMAYADQINGPWTVYEPGTLQLDQCPCAGHIASPDLHIDEQQQRLIMYYHGVDERVGPSNYSGQRSYVAESKNGLDFTTHEPVLGAFYFRVFHYNDAVYSIAKSIDNPGGGVLQRSDDGFSPFEFGPEIIPNMRHAAVHLLQDELEVFYSKGLDTPERIYKGTINLNGDWRQWTLSNEIEILRPERHYEGANEPLIESKFGCVNGMANQLRDPGYFQDPTDGKEYICYSIAGECGLAIAEIIRD